MSRTNRNSEKEFDRPAAHPSGVARLLVPSVADLIFIALFLSLLLGGLSTRLLGDADTGWHIRNGRADPGHSIDSAHGFVLFNDVREDRGLRGNGCLMCWLADCM